MKRIHLAWILSTQLLCGVAHAQNSVTLYGLIDEDRNFTTNASGERAYQLVSGDAVGSRWGIKGHEDLGAGVAAVFQLESGFNSNTGGLGQGGRLFGRQAYVGLSSAPYGKLTMGLQNDPTVDMWSDFTAAGKWEGDLASHPYDNDNADEDFRIQNAVKYVTPTISGLAAEMMAGFSDGSGGFANNRMYSAAAHYQRGPLCAAIAYMKIDNGGANDLGTISSATTVFTANSQQNIDAGVSYRFFDKLNVSLAYSHVDVDNPTSNAYFTNQPAAGSQLSWKFDNFEINGQYFFVRNFWLGLAYTYTRAHVVTTTGQHVPDWNQVSMMLDYDLSARTSVYLQYAYQHANGGTGEDFDYANIVGSPSQSSTSNQMVYGIAVSHQF